MKKKQPFFFEYFRSDVSLDNQPFTLDLNLFYEETKMIVSMMSQLLGLDTYIYVPEFLMSLLFIVSMSQSNS